jgi:hypothetical protein
MTQLFETKKDYVITEQILKAIQKFSTACERESDDDRLVDFVFTLEIYFHFLEVLMIGSDIQRVKDMEVDHIVFVYNFRPIGRSVNEMIDTSKQLSKYAI